jgi:hypothetical protein
MDGRSVILVYSTTACFRRPMSTDAPGEEEPPEGVDRDEWLAQEVEDSWTHVASGDLCSGPTAGWCDIFARREDDGSYSLRFFGEGLEPSDPPLELDLENYPDIEEAAAALSERGFEVEARDLPGYSGPEDAPEEPPTGV